MSASQKDQFGSSSAGLDPPASQSSDSRPARARAGDTDEVINLLSDDETEILSSQGPPKKMKQTQLPFKPGKPTQNQAHKTLSPPEIMRAVRGLKMFTSVPAGSLLFDLLDKAISTQPASQVEKMGRLIEHDAHANRIKQPTTLFRDMLLGPVDGSTSKGAPLLNSTMESPFPGSSQPRLSRDASQAGPYKTTTLSSPAVSSRAGKERAAVLDLDSSSDSDIEILSSSAGPSRPSGQPREAKFEVADSARALKQTPLPPPAASPKKRQRLSPGPAPRSLSSTIPIVSPSLAASFSPSSFASSSRATLSASRGPEDSPHRRSSRVPKPAHEPLAKHKLGPKTADGRRKILGRPNDDDNGRPERCSWCHREQEDECTRKLCLEGEENWPDAMACKPCKKVYEGERRRGTSHPEAISTLLVTVQASRAEHQKTLDAL